ncbi:hypothetical protein MKEN_00351100 [Mycena kentingensis (nom. inval.)]|nr:hypothetical protein MKEN_00351100 [Mycena kentingensis (nom. inval.)]
MDPDLKSLFFTINPDDPFVFDIQGRLDFWNNNRAFFAETHGLSLYELALHQHHPSLLTCWPSQYPNSGGSYPYAHCEDIRQHTEWKYGKPFSTSTMGLVVYANDQEKRPVALKLVEHESNEHTVLKLIIDVQNRDGYIPGIVPVLSLVAVAGHWAVVMPRWSCSPVHGWFCSVKELLFCLEELLSGLVFLHSHRVVHRDLSRQNCLANLVLTNVNNVQSDNPANWMQNLQASHSVRYGWIDFGWAVVLPPLTALESCRLHCKQAHYGAWDPPPDVALGERTYNPFAFDVGTLGLYLACFTQHLTPQIPLLAPFLDKMITRNVASRFTAQSALDFLRFIQQTLTEEELKEPCPHPGYKEQDSYMYDRWSALPRHFVQEWQHMREPAPSKLVRLGWRLAEMSSWFRGVLAFCQRGLDWVRGVHHDVSST